MAGNGNSGNVIAFRLSDNQLEKKIREFREEYGTGEKGMVTWPRFCAFLGYSVEEVTECYQRGKQGKNAYNMRAEALGRFHTECKALTNETCDKKQALAREEVKTNYLNPEMKEGGGGELRILFGGGDDRWTEAMK